MSTESRSRRRRLAILVIGMLLVVLLLLAGCGLLVGERIADARTAYARYILRTGKEPAFLLTSAFLLTFAAVRFVTYAIHDEAFSFFRNITTKSGLHIHHMVPGMLLALASGYLGLVLTADRPVRLLAILFGIGEALVLDEFALWLRLADVYWEPAGRESIDAVVLAVGIGVLYLLGFDFWPRLIAAGLELLRTAH